MDLWNWFAGLCGHVLSSQPHVRSRCFIDLCCVCFGLLSTTDCWSVWYLNTVFFIGCSGKYSDRSSCGMVCTLKQQVICDCFTPGRAGSIASSSAQSSVVRGPPRKPRQSGHAIWIGNLPPQTDLMSLVLHVCKETVGLESLFLISKSNCAFANFKDEAACAAAQVKIHDSRFQTVRLVSRLRRNSVGTASGVTVPTGPAALTPPSNPMVARSTTPDSDTKPKEGEEEIVESKGADES